MDEPEKDEMAEKKTTTPATATVTGIESKTATGTVSARADGMAFVTGIATVATASLRRG
jgi:hypothetical protein